MRTLIITLFGIACYAGFAFLFCYTIGRVYGVI